MNVCLWGVIRSSSKFAYEFSNSQIFSIHASTFASDLSVDVCGWLGSSKKRCQQCFFLYCLCMAWDAFLWMWFVLGWVIGWWGDYRSSLGPHQKFVLLFWCKRTLTKPTSLLIWDCLHMCLLRLRFIGRWVVERGGAGQRGQISKEGGDAYLTCIWRARSCNTWHWAQSMQKVRVMNGAKGVQVKEEDKGEGGAGQRGQNNKEGGDALLGWGVITGAISHPKNPYVFCRFKSVVITVFSFVLGLSAHVFRLWYIRQWVVGWWVIFGSDSLHIKKKKTIFIRILWFDSSPAGSLSTLICMLIGWMGRRTNWVCWLTKWMVWTTVYVYPISFQSDILCHETRNSGYHEIARIFFMLYYHPTQMSVMFFF